MSCADVCLDMHHDGNEFYADEMLRARVRHKCCECRRTILPGERYERAAGKYDGRMWSAKSCAECVEIRKALVCGGWVFSQLWEAIKEEVFPVWLTTSPIDCLAKIESLAARDKLRAAFDEWRKDWA